MFPYMGIFLFIFTIKGIYYVKQSDVDIPFIQTIYIYAKKKTLNSKYLSAGHGSNK